MRWIHVEEHSGQVGYAMKMMLYVDDLCWFMLDLGLNEVIMKYMKFNLGICVKFMIYDEYMWWAWEYDMNTPAVHV